MINILALKIFISRKIEEGSLLKKLERSGHSLLGFGGVDFSSVQFSSFPQTDWIFFYSKNGIIFFSEQLTKEEIQGLKSKKIGVMGQASAAILQNRLGMPAHFIAGGDQADDEIKFTKATEGESVLFIEADISLKRFQKRNLPSHHSLVVYKNEIIENLHLPGADIYIFTSPLNAKAFLEHNKPAQNATLIAIGPTTKKEILNYVSTQEIITCPSPEESVVMATLSGIIHQ